MDDPEGPWSPGELRAFLEAEAIPIRLATRRQDGSPWVVALWHRYQDGGFECATAADAAVVAHLRRDASVGFDVSTNRPPYRGVRGNGTASLQPDEGKATLRALIERYLGDTDSELATWLLADDREEVRIRIEPATLFTWDYTARMAGGSGAD